jgi:predicted nucleic acid-binding protein
VILVDTSIWIDHLRRADALLSSLLDAGRVLMHPYVFGELAMGDLRPRGTVLHSLSRLPEMLPARDSEVLALVDRQRLFGTGIGFIDAHLLTAVRLMPEATLWTRDQRLLAAAERLSLAARPHDA